MWYTGKRRREVYSIALISENQQLDVVYGEEEEGGTV